MNVRNMDVREVKRFPNGAREVVFCDLVYREPGAMLLRFIHTEDPYAAAAVATEVAIWEGRDYLLYKLFDTLGRPQGYRIEVCQGLLISEGSVKRVDLGLQLLVDNVGTARLAGEDLVADYQAKGLLSKENQDLISRAREFLLDNYNQVINEAEELRSRAQGRRNKP